MLSVMLPTTIMWKPVMSQQYLYTPSTLTFEDLGYADDSAIVTCQNATLMGAMTSSIRMGE